MELQLINQQTNKADGKVTVSDIIFEREYNEGLVHQLVTTYQAGMRQGSHRQKNRAAVSGGGKKPWRQKGTGRARAGTTRGPIWRGGGRAFAADNRDYSQKLNKKMYKAGLRSILSELVRQDRLVIVNEFTVEAPKTKLLVQKLNALDLTDVLIITHDYDETLMLAANNIPLVGVVTPREANPLCLVGYAKVLITSEALKQLEERLA